MTTDPDIETPYHIAFAGALLSVAEAGSDFFLYDFYVDSMPIHISETQWMIQAAIGLVVALGIAAYLYLHHRNEDLTKDAFLYVIIASLVGLLIGGQLAALITLIGAYVCYRRF